MLYELENNLDTLLAPKIGGTGGFYSHEISSIVKEMLGRYSFQKQLTALGEIEGSETAGNYAQTLGESVSRALVELLTNSVINRLEKAREDFKVTKEAVLEEGYTLVSYHHADKLYYGMAKPGEPTEFLDSEYAAVMSVKPVEEVKTHSAVMEALGTPGPSIPLVEVNIGGAKLKGYLESAPLGGKDFVFLGKVKGDA